MGARRYRTGTYRLQVNRQFTLDAARDLIDYLVELGVGAVYLSPILESAPGSVHGYDTMDPRKVSIERGGDAAFDAFAHAAAERGINIVLDIVPNHLAASEASPFWRDVLTNGRGSQFADLFDIEWDSPAPALAAKVLLPVLSEHYSSVLHAGGLSIEQRDGSAVLRCEQLTLPLRPDADQAPAATTDIDAIDALIERQHYRLAFWRTANRQINYRRFFAINSLAGVRVEQPEVFDLMHNRALEWVRAGRLAGLRIDHPDGLADPSAYFYRLRAAVPDVWIIAEKILQPGELLPADWPIDGTTGYDFLNQLNGLFVDQSAEPAMTDLYTRFTGQPGDYADVLYDCKRLVLCEMFSGELDRLSRLLAPIAAADRRCRDVPACELRDALVELIACLPVYRTYVRAGSPASEADRQFVRKAAQLARSRRPDIYAGTLAMLADALLAPDRAGGAEFAIRFQQLCGPAMAKGAEDTALYRHYRLASLNEVGGDPGRFGNHPDAFHDYCRTMQSRWPEAMTASSTHDTKRSEDVRARINVLSELPDEWADTVVRWETLNDVHRRDGMPSRNDEYLFYQTLVGVWPVEPARLVDYMRKAAREARLVTDWDCPNQAYESACEHFVRATLADARFVSELERLTARLRWPGQVNSLAQTVLRLTAPGVPDIYQGNETWDFSLVDPDNRRAIDYAVRRGLLAELRSLATSDILAGMDRGLCKMHVIRTCLSLRRRLADAFGPNGEYQPVRASGPRAGHVIAFIRGGRVISVAPRLPLTLAGQWCQTELPLPRGQWRDELTGQLWPGDRQIRLAELLRQFPVAVLAMQV